MTGEYTEAAVRFADALLRTHHTLPRSPDDPVQRCACGRAMVMCEINAAARDAGLLTAVTGPGSTSSPGKAVIRAQFERFDPSGGTEEFPTRMRDRARAARAVWNGTGAR